MSNEIKILENTPILETSRLILRKFTINDIEDFLLIMSDNEVNTFLPWFPIKTLEQAEQMIQENYLSYYNKTSAYRYAICLKSNNRPIGYVRLSSSDSNDFGYGLKRNFWYKGIVTEASQAVINRIKGVGIPYITATHDINNPQSGQVMKKIGNRKI